MSYIKPITYKYLLPRKNFYPVFSFKENKDVKEDFNNGQIPCKIYIDKKNQQIIIEIIENGKIKKLPILNTVNNYLLNENYIKIKPIEIGG